MKKWQFIGIKDRMSFPPHPNVNTFRPLQVIVIRLKEVYEVLYDLVFCMGEGRLNFSPFFQRFELPLSKWDFWANNLLGYRGLKSFTHGEHILLSLRFVLGGSQEACAGVETRQNVLEFCLTQQWFLSHFFTKTFEQSSQMSKLLLSEWHDHFLLAHSL